MELSSSRTSINTEDYSLITHEKCNPPRAKLFIVFLVSLVVAILIVLLVVLTRLNTPTATNPSDPNQCADVAIIGGGLAGSYLAWRLRHTNKTLVLYEKSARLGGRFYSLPTQNNSKGHIKELGASFFIRGLHEAFDDLVTHLNLQTEPYTKIEYNEPDEYYVRGHNLTYIELAGTECPYNVKASERGHTPLKLLRLLLSEGYQQFDDNVTESQTAHTDTWRDFLNNRNLQNLILERGSYEAYQYLQDTLRWWEYHSAGNAEASLEYLLALEEASLEPDVMDMYTIQGGMDLIIKELIRQTTQVKPRLSVLMEQEVLGIESQPGHHYISVYNTGEVTDEEVNVNRCAKTVIFAIPPEALSKIHFDQPEIASIWQTNIENLTSVSMLRVFVEVSGEEPLWENYTASWAKLKTDIPIQDASFVDYYCVSVPYVDEPVTVTVTEPSPDNSSSSSSFEEITDSTETYPTQSTVTQYEVIQCTTVIEISINDVHWQYWLYLLKADGIAITDNIIEPDITSSNFVAHLSRHLAEMFGHSGDLTGLSKVLLKFWHGGETTDAFHIWKPGVDWTAASDAFQKPINDVTMYLVGSDYAPGYLQFWAEGALRSVNKLISDGIT